jgi:hypothetical protein
MAYAQIEQLRGAQDQVRALAETLTTTRHQIAATNGAAFEGEIALRAAVLKLGDVASDLETAILALDPPQPLPAEAGTARGGAPDA